MGACMSEDRTVLLYGCDPILMESRRLLLTTSGFNTDVAFNSRELVKLTCQRETPYKLMILCHTVEPAEQELIKLEAARSQIPLLCLGLGTEPESFIKDVRSLILKDVWPLLSVLRQTEDR